MDEKLLNNYKNTFINYFNKQININKYDEIIKNENLLINPTDNYNSNINSIYYKFINNFYIEKLNDKDKEIILQKENIDEELYSIVKRTYIDILKNNNADKNLYYPNYIVQNGSLVLIFSYGKTNKELNDEEYYELSKKQKEFIKKINTELKLEVQEKLNINCEIFIEKRY